MPTLVRSHLDMVKGNDGNEMVGRYMAGPCRRRRRHNILFFSNPHFFSSLLLLATPCMHKKIKMKMLSLIQSRVRLRRKSSRFFALTQFIFVVPIPGPQMNWDLQLCKWLLQFDGIWTTGQKIVISRLQHFSSTTIFSFFRLRISSKWLWSKRARKHCLLYNTHNSLVTLKVSSRS